jgi:hypothetical protein
MTNDTYKQAASSDKAKATLPTLLWLILPVLYIVIQVCMEIFLSNEALQPMHTEGGAIEIMQFMIMLPATITAAWLAFKVKDKFLKLWLLAAALGCFYITGEEVSWGQWIYGWTTPDFWSGVNDQNETNLHNTTAWLDQKPRALLFIGIVFSGIIVPILRRVRPEWIPSRFGVLLPSDALFVTSLGVLLPYLVQEISDVFFDTNLFLRVSEVQEVYIYYFLLLYLLDFHKRVFSQE